MPAKTEPEAPMRTREKNSDVHPGKKFKEDSMSRRPPRPREVIEKEKAEKAAAQQRRAQAKLLKAAGEERALQLEQERREKVALEDEQIPRRFKLPVNKKEAANVNKAPDLMKKRKKNDYTHSDRDDASEDTHHNATKKTKRSHKVRQASPASPLATPQLKRQRSPAVTEPSDNEGATKRIDFREIRKVPKKIKPTAQPLRRHETVLEINDLEDKKTPTRNQRKEDTSDLSTDVSEPNSPFKSPQTLRKASHPHHTAKKTKKTYAEVVSGSGSEEETETEMRKEGEQGKKLAENSPANDKQSTDIIPRKTSSNPIVGSKKGSSANGAKKRIKRPADDSKEAHLQAIGGLNEEDDALEREAAISSPLKGTESRGSAKAMIKGKKGKGKTKRRAARIEDLPADARTTWQTTVIPNLLFIILSEEQPWEVSDDNLKSVLAKVCDHAYKNRVKIDVEKGDVAFELAIQVLYNYRSKFAVNAIHVVLNNLCKWLNVNLSRVNDNWDRLSDLAKELLHKRRFIFKGCEPPGEFHLHGRFSNVLIIETFQSHFSAYTQGQAIFKTGPSFCGLALATAAVERALTLVHKKLLTVAFDSRSFKFAITKTVNPNTGKSSAIENEFSAQNWNTRTLRHLKDVHALGEARFNQVFDMASNSRLVRSRSRANPEPTRNDSDDSDDDTLQSEDNNEGDSDKEIAHVENNVMQGHENDHSAESTDCNDDDENGSDGNDEDIYYYST